MAEPVQASASGTPMRPPVGTGHELRTMTTRDLVTELARKASRLARTEVQLAKVEIRADLRRELTTAGGLGVAGLCALCTLNLLLVAGVFGLIAAGVVGWLAALIVAAFVLAVGTIAGLLGWMRRVRSPMGITRRTLKDDLQWAKERVA